MQLHNSFQNIITIVTTLNVISTSQFVLRSQLVEFKYIPVMLLKLKIVNKCKLGSTRKMQTVKLLINAPGVYSNNRQIPPAFSGPGSESSSSKS